MKDINNHFTYAYSAGTEADFQQVLSADAVSTNAIDLKKAAINIAAGKRPIYLIVKAPAAWSGTGSIEIQLCTGTSSDKSTGKKVIRKWRFADTDVTAALLLSRGAVLINEVLPVVKYQRFLYLYFNIFTTTGNVEGYLSDAPESAETDTAQTATGS